jgi:glycosyltransferase involved in cell wall biosynthesis
LGEVSPEELAALYQGAVATINPSIYEGFGLPVLEAQALGVPVISSRGGSLPEVAGDGALYFSHDSPAELGAAMESLLDEPARRVDLIELGAENVARFSWDRAADETAAVLIHVGRPG